MNLIKKALFFIMLFVLSVLFFLCWIFFTDFDDEGELIVAVLDTGIDYSHEKLKDRIIKGYDFVQLDNDPFDEEGHGTHIAGIIEKQTKETKILSIRMIDDYVHSVFPILYSIIKGSDIVNMSFTGEENPFTELALMIGKRKGIIFIASAGNEGKEVTGYPAKSKYTIAVGSISENRNELTNISNYGKETDYYVSGEKVMSTTFNNGYKMNSGTSMAAAQMSGLIAYLKEKDFSNKEIYRLLETEKILIKEIRNGKEVELAIVDYKKIKAKLENESYMWTRKVFDGENKEVELNILGLNIDEIAIYHLRKPIYRTFNTEELKIKVPLKSGTNEIIIIGKYGKEVIMKKMNTYLDKREK